jgi:hypothetical protein
VSKGGIALRASVLPYSRLVIVWFQHNATVPAGRDIPASLRDVRWEDRAQDEEI